jgi:hypothetical protein
MSGGGDAAPRRSRQGHIIVGPTVLARALPGLLAGLPLLALLLGAFPATGIQAWQRRRLRAGHDGPLEQLLEPALVQFLAGALVVWVLIALWALVALSLMRRSAVLDLAQGVVRRRRGLRGGEARPLADVVHAEADPERGGVGVIDFADGARWIVPEAGWDDRSFAGFLALQEAAGLEVQAPRAELRRQDRRAHRIARDQESAARIDMPWDPAYEEDPGAFLAEFDRRRRVLGGKEEPRPGDLTRETVRRREAQDG